MGNVVFWNGSRDGSYRATYPRRQEAGTATKFDNFVCCILKKVSRDNAHARGLKGDSLYATSNAMGIGLTLFAILLAAVSAIVIARETSRQLGRDPGELLVVAQRVVDGDLQ